MDSERSKEFRFCGRRDITSACFVRKKRQRPWFVMYLITLFAPASSAHRGNIPIAVALSGRGRWHKANAARSPGEPYKARPTASGYMAFDRRRAPSRLRSGVVHENDM